MPLIIALVWLASLGLIVLGLTAVITFAPAPDGRSDVQLVRFLALCWTVLFGLSAAALLVLRRTHPDAYILTARWPALIVVGITTLLMGAVVLGAVIGP